MAKDTGVWVYDIETITNCFTYTAIHRNSDKTVMFVIWKDRNDFPDLVKHLNECRGMVGFNSLSFDYPVIHKMLQNKKRFLKMDADEIAKEIYGYAQEIITELNKEDGKRTTIQNPLIPQLDLFKIHHFDNKARMTSLKKLEIALQFDNVEDMPHHHTKPVETQEELDNILSYNLNDVRATKAFLDKTKDKINLRLGLKKRYDLDCVNYSDSKIGEELMLKLYCEKTGKPLKEVKYSRSNKTLIRFEDCILPYIKFATPEFNELLTYLKSIERIETKDSFKYSFTYNDFTFELGMGGIHGCIKPGIYQSNDERIIIDADVASLYPSLAVVNNLYPRHLGSVFSKIYEDEIVKPRIAAKKAGDKVMADGFKLSANSVYGKSNSQFSFLFDPLYTIKTTLAGQLSLCMLSEMIMTRIPSTTMLQINTDGLTVIIPREEQELYYEICREWEATTKLGLEYVNYDKMVIRDVNSYLSVADNGKVKYKGAFRPHTEMIKEGEFHKAFNQGIVPLALAEYYINGTPPEETVRNHRNIYDFCKTYNGTKGWEAETVALAEDGTELDIRKEQKNNRYYISKEGRKFRKNGFTKTGEPRVIDVDSSDLVIIFNKYEEKPFEEYKVDFDYYIKECYKIIDTISGEKERLLFEKSEQMKQAKLDRETKNYLENCINKNPTQRMYDLYRRDYLVEKYGEPKLIKTKKDKATLSMFDGVDIAGLFEVKEKPAE